VPLELSEEQFWRKYLESEYFHRDRGRLGTHFEKRKTLGLDKKDDDGELTLSNNDENGDGANDATTTNTSDPNNPNNSTANSKKEEAKEQEENARVAAASSSDIFSRAELELQTKHPHGANNQNIRTNTRRTGNIALAIGQFDLASTANTERGSKLLLYSNDNHQNRPSNNESDTTKGSKVIEKYNRHWAIVMNPAIATARSNLMDLARESVGYALEGDEDANGAGGVGKEMERLVGFASAKEGRVDHVKGLGDPVTNQTNAPHGIKGVGGSSLFQELNLQTTIANLGTSLHDTTGKNERLDNLATLSVLNSVMRYDTVSATNKSNSFPEPSFGRDLLLMLTKKMKKDSETESDTIKMTNQLDVNFRNKLTLYFQRATELLRHFFALRQVMETEKRLGNKRSSIGRTTTAAAAGSKKNTSDKITKVVDCMKKVYHEMDVMRDDLPSETMRGMCFPIMSVGLCLYAFCLWWWWWICHCERLDYGSEIVMSSSKGQRLSPKVIYRILLVLENITSSLTI